MIEDGPRDPVAMSAFETQLSKKMLDEKYPEWRQSGLKPKAAVDFYFNDYDRTELYDQVLAERCITCLSRYAINIHNSDCRRCITKRRNRLDKEYNHF